MRNVDPFYPRRRAEAKGDTVFTGRASVVRTDGLVLGFGEAGRAREGGIGDDGRVGEGGRELECHVGPGLDVISLADGFEVAEVVVDGVESGDAGVGFLGNRSCDGGGNEEEGGEGEKGEGEGGHFLRLLMGIGNVVVVWIVGLI